MYLEHFGCLLEYRFFFGCVRSTLLLWRLPLGLPARMMLMPKALRTNRSFLGKVFAPTERA